MVNQSPEEAQWTDLFMGEEAGNAAWLDLGKVQMFFFTIILAFAYAVNLGELFQDAGIINEFPTFDDGMVALLGISHAGYLTNKAIPHSQRA
jgi:hypothetical protein